MTDHADTEDSAEGLEGLEGRHAQDAAGAVGFDAGRLPPTSLPFDEHGRWVGVPGRPDIGPPPGLAGGFDDRGAADAADPFGEALGGAGDLGAAGDGRPDLETDGRLLTRRRRRSRPRPMRVEVFEVPGACVAIGYDPTTGLAAARVLAVPSEVGARGLRGAVKALARSRALRALAGVAVDVIKVVPYGNTALQALGVARRAVRAAREAMESDDLDEEVLALAAGELDDGAARAVLRESVRRRVPPEALAHVARELGTTEAP